MNRRVDFCECWPAECPHTAYVPDSSTEPIDEVPC